MLDARKSRILSTSGAGIANDINVNVALDDSAIEGATRAIKGARAFDIKLLRNARLVGKQGGIESTRDLRLDGTGSTIDGGSGPGIEAGMNSHISFKQGTLKGTRPSRPLPSPCAWSSTGRT